MFVRLVNKYMNIHFDHTTAIMLKNGRHTDRLVVEGTDVYARQETMNSHATFLVHVDMNEIFLSEVA